MRRKHAIRKMVFAKIIHVMASCASTRWSAWPVNVSMEQAAPVVMVEQVAWAELVEMLVGHRAEAAGILAMTRRVAAAPSENRIRMRCQLYLA